MYLKKVYIYNYIYQLIFYILYHIEIIKYSALLLIIIYLAYFYCNDYFIEYFI